MKLLKYSFITLIVALAVEGILVSAYSSPSSMQISKQLEANKLQYTGYVTKNTWVKQTYYNRDTYTPMTNPCPNCKISAKIWSDTGTSSGEIITTKGQTKGTSETGTNSPGNYRVAIKRSDFTLLTTYHFATWNINI